MSQLPCPTHLPRRICPFWSLTTNIARAVWSFTNSIHCEHSTCFGKALATTYLLVHVPASLISESNQRLMVHLLAVLSRLLCFTRTDIDETHELPTRPKQSSPRPLTPNHGPRSLTAEQPQPPLPPTDGIEDLDSSMPLKRKNADTAATMDCPEKKTKTTKKSKKAAPAQEEGKLICLSLFITFAYDARREGLDGEM
jgi:hypothetical protein